MSGCSGGFVPTDWNESILMCVRACMRVGLWVCACVRLCLCTSVYLSHTHFHSLSLSQAPSLHVAACLSTRARVSTCAYLHVSLRMRVCACLYMCVYACVSTCACLCVSEVRKS